MKIYLNADTILNLAKGILVAISFFQKLEKIVYT